MAFFRKETSARPHFRTLTAAAPQRRYGLRGRIVTMNATRDIIDDGYLCIENDSIAALGAWTGALPAPFEAEPLIRTMGTIYPGLIELHNHPAYNADVAGYAAFRQPVAVARGPGLQALGVQHRHPALLSSHGDASESAGALR
jgi:imidazolonepropionase-like amidohydrolase